MVDVDWHIDDKVTEMRLRMQGRVAMCRNCRFFIPGVDSDPIFCTQRIDHPPTIVAFGDERLYYCTQYQDKAPHE